MGLFKSIANVVSSPVRAAANVVQNKDPFAALGVTGGLTAGGGLGSMLGSSAGEGMKKLVTGDKDAVAAFTGMSPEQQQQYLAAIRAARTADLAEGRKRGEEIFGTGSLATRTPAEIKADMMDVLARRKAGLQGMSGEEQNALRQQALGRIGQLQQTQARQLRGAQGASGVRGATAAAQMQRLLSGAQGEQARTEQDLFLQDLANRKAALGDYQTTIGEEQKRSQAEKYGQLSTEFGYGALGAAERGGAANLAAAASQSAQAAASMNKTGGKK